MKVIKNLLFWIPLLLLISFGSFLIGVGVATCPEQETYLETCLRICDERGEEDCFRACLGVEELIELL